MIRESEFRIGNWLINFLGEEFQVTQLPISPMYPRPTPIPLTPEWLRKFNYQLGCCTWYIEHWQYAIGTTKELNKVSLRLASMDKALTIYQDKQGKFFSKPNFGTFLVYFEYVHELQNWYFYNSGKYELEIKS